MILEIIETFLFQIARKALLGGYIYYDVHIMMDRWIDVIKFWIII